MNLKSVAYLAGLALVGGVTAAPAPAVAFNPAPLGYQLMCLKSPSLCKAGGPSAIAASPDVLKTLMTVNLEVNRSIRPHADGAQDVWSVDVASGDCEDYAMTKRQRLIGLGLPPSALRIAYVTVQDGEGHAILVVKARGRTYVLDNLTNAIRPLDATGYHLISMSGADPLHWS